MRICRRSIPERALSAAGLMLIAMPAMGQDLPSTPNARDQAQAQGAVAMDRLKESIARRKPDTTAGPTQLPALPDEQRRRAFEGLRKHGASPVMDARARAALDKGKAGLAAEREIAAKRLAQALGLEAPDMQAVAAVIAPPAQSGRVPLLFASSSMPVATLRTYAAQLERVGGVIAFRGMPGGLSQVAPMAKLSAQILRIDPGCEGPACAMRNVQIIIDTLVFRQHGIIRVPALGLIPADPTQPYCEREENNPQSQHIIYGDAALSGLLEEYARLGGAREVADVQARLERR